MLTGKSIWHVNQDIGKCFSTDSIKGYYNNMTEKVTKMPELLDNDGLPLLNTSNGEVEMPVASNMDLEHTTFIYRREKRNILRSLIKRLNGRLPTKMKKGGGVLSFMYIQSILMGQWLGVKALRCFCELIPIVAIENTLKLLRKP